MSFYENYIRGNSGEITREDIYRIGAQSRQIEITESDFEPTATSEVAFKAVGIMLLGALVCATKFYPIGVAMLVMGLLWLACCPMLAHMEEQANIAQKQQQAAGTGQGCAANVWAVLVGAGLLTIAGVIALGGGMALMGGQ